MAETKITSDGYGLTVWWAAANAFSDWRKPTVAEVQACVNITGSISWENWSFGAQASQQNSDPSMLDVGNTQTLGFAQFGGQITFFYPDNYDDVTDESYITFAALDQPRTLGYILIRADGQKTTGGQPDQNKDIVANDFVSIYKVMSDAWSDTVTGQNNFKYTITFLPQGDLYVNAMVATSVTVVTPAAIGATDYSVGGKTPLGTYLTGRQLAATAGINNGYPAWFDWSSDDPAVATVDSNGVVTGVSAGSADITATWPATGTSSSALTVTIS